MRADGSSLIGETRKKELDPRLEAHRVMQQFIDVDEAS